MNKLSKAWEILGSIHHWDKPAEFLNMNSVDFSEKNRWLAAQKIIEEDSHLSFLHMLQATLYFLSMMAGPLYVWQFGAGKSVHVLVIEVFSLYVGIMSLSCLIWSMMTVRASILAEHSNPHSWLTRTIRAWLMQLPFWVLPGFAVGAILWFVLPMRLKARFAGSRSIDSLVLLGRYWQYSLALIGAGQGTTFADRVLDMATLTVSKRTDVFDCAMEARRYTKTLHSVLGAIVVFGLVKWILSIGGLSPDHLLPAKQSGIAFLLAAFSVIGAYLFFSWRDSAYAMVWFPVMLEEMKEARPEELEPAFPPVDPWVRPTYALWGLFPLMLAIVTFGFVAKLG